MTHDDASVETGVGGQAKYDVMMVFCGNALQKHLLVLKLFVHFFANCSLLYLFVIWYMFACVPQHTGQERV